MSEQRKRRDSLLRSSISINSIRDSVSNFSKGLTESNAVANQIVEIRDGQLIKYQGDYKYYKEKKMEEEREKEEKLQLAERERKRLANREKQRKKKKLKNK